MKSILTILLLQFGVIAFSQVVKGTVKDLTNDEALLSVNIHVNGTVIGTVTDESGAFELDVKGGDTLIFSYVGYQPHWIVNLQSQEDTINLGEVRFCDAGYQAYVLYAKKRLFSKKEKVVCKYVDTTKQLTVEERTVEDSKGNVRYIWERNKSEAFQIDYRKMLGNE